MNNDYTITPPKEGELTEKGFTKRIKINEGVTVKQLLEYGFSNNHKSTLYFMRMVGDDESFSLKLDKESLKITSIDILDENFLQPYDYQSILMKNRHQKYAQGVFDNVDKILEKLQNDGIINGYHRGMYV
ncbi:hypothetical protein KDN24_06505 [Bacillus sp. Bva_UNVM-123]|uniref:hypothetical protein n=1 Tax=Bacillus sp. Bva_UNVM-123 TaxID=2829798 RepID=UPI00391F954D